MGGLTVQVDFGGMKPNRGFGEFRSRQTEEMFLLISPMFARLCLETVIRHTSGVKNLKPAFSAIL